MLAHSLLALEGALRTRRAVAPADVKQVLFLQYRLPLGCCVHLSPVFEALKRSRPEIQIIVTSCGIGVQVHRHSKFIDHVIETPDPLINLLPAVVELRAQLRLRNAQPDCVFTGASDQRTRLVLLGVLASNGWRAGYTQQPFLYKYALAYNGSLSLIRNNLRLARLLDCNEPVDQSRVHFSQRDVDSASALLMEANPDGRQLVVMVTQSSGGQSKNWHDTRWVKVIDAAVTAGCAVAYVGTGEDIDAIAAVDDRAGKKGSSLAGKTTIPQLAAVLSLADVVVTLDTGTMHVGRAVGVPMVVLAPSWQPPLEWLPLDVANIKILRGEDRSDMPPGYRLDEISAESVITAMNHLLWTYPLSAEGPAFRIAQSLSAVDHLAGRSREGSKEEISGGLVNTPSAA